MAFDRAAFHEAAGDQDQQPDYGFEPGDERPPLVLVGEPVTAPETPETIGSTSQQYMAVLHESVIALQAAQRSLEAQRRFTGPKLDEAYWVNPFLKPERLGDVVQADEAYRSYTSVDRGFGGRDAPEMFVARKVADNDLYAGRYPHLSAAMAAAATRRYDLGGSYGGYRELLAHDRVREVISQHLHADLGLFALRGVSELPDDALRTFKLTKDEIDAYDQAGRMLGAGNLPVLEEPPLYLTQLAADIMNYNSDSVMPIGLSVVQWRLRGWRQPSGHKDMADRITSALGGYLQQRYGLVRPSKGLLSILAECDLAERQGFMDAPDEQQKRTAKRANPIFTRVIDRRKLPDEIRPLVELSLSIDTAA